MKFDSLEYLELELFDYVNLYNTHRIHGSIGYLTTVAYKAFAFGKTPFYGTMLLIIKCIGILCNLKKVLYKKRKRLDLVNFYR